MNELLQFRPGARFTVATVEEYLAFLDARPEDERWELIDGEAIMMTPPTMCH